MLKHPVTNPGAKVVPTPVRRGSSRAPGPLPLWTWPTALSLDAPAVAVAWQWLFARSFGVALTPYFVLGLGLTVWLVYVGTGCWTVSSWTCGNPTPTGTRCTHGTGARLHFFGSPLWGWTGYLCWPG